MQRRTFFKVGLAGALVLGAGAFAARTLAPRVPTTPVAGAFLDESGRQALRKIVPAILGDVFDSPAAAGIEATIDRIDHAIAGLAPATQKEVAELMLLLTLKPARWALSGVSNWSEATPQMVAAFLQSWRTHKVSLLQVAYHALHDLIGGAHYAHPNAWARIGFALPAAFADAPQGVAKT